MRGFTRGGPKFLIVTALLIVLPIEQRVGNVGQGKQFQRQQNNNTPTTLLRKDGDGEFSGKRIPRLMREVYQAKAELDYSSDNTISNVQDYGAKCAGAMEDTKLHGDYCANKCTSSGIRSLAVA